MLFDLKIEIDTKVQGKKTIKTYSQDAYMVELAARCNTKELLKAFEESDVEPDKRKAIALYGLKQGMQEVGKKVDEFKIDRFFDAVGDFVVAMGLQADLKTDDDAFLCLVRLIDRIAKYEAEKRFLPSCMGAENAILAFSYEGEVLQEEMAQSALMTVYAGLLRNGFLHTEEDQVGAESIAPYLNRGMSANHKALEAATEFVVKNEFASTGRGRRNGFGASSEQIIYGPDDYKKAGLDIPPERLRRQLVRAFRHKLSSSLDSDDWPSEALCSFIDRFQIPPEVVAKEFDRRLQKEMSMSKRRLTRLKNWAETLGIASHSKVLRSKPIQAVLHEKLIAALKLKTSHEAMLDFAEKHPAASPVDCLRSVVGNDLSQKIDFYKLSQKDAEAIVLATARKIFESSAQCSASFDNTHFIQTFEELTSFCDLYVTCFGLEKEKLYKFACESYKPTFKDGIVLSCMTTFQSAVDMKRRLHAVKAGEEDPETDQTDFVMIQELSELDAGFKIYRQLHKELDLAKVDPGNIYELFAHAYRAGYVMANALMDPLVNINKFETELESIDSFMRNQVGLSYENLQYSAKVAVTIVRRYAAHQLYDDKVAKLAEQFFMSDLEIRSLTFEEYERRNDELAIAEEDAKKVSNA